MKTSNEKATAPNVRAWLVKDKYEDSMVIEFATAPGKAKALGAMDLDLDFTETRVKRAPEFDQFAGSEHIPAQAYLERGWWVGCTSCQRMVWGEDHGTKVDGDLVLCRECATAEKEKGVA